MKDSCFLLPQGWKMPDGQCRAISVRRTAALGDCIAATVVADRLMEQQIQVTFAAFSSFLPVIKLHPGIAEFKDQNFIADITLDQAYEKDPRRQQRHMTEFFIDRANQQLASRQIKLSYKNCRPRLRPTEGMMAAKRFFKDHPKPWVIINPRAAPRWHNRQVPSHIWQAAAKKIKGTCFWLGVDPGPEGMVDLHCRTIDMLAPYISQCDLMVTVDTGPMHLAAALGKPIVAIGQACSPELRLSDQVDFEVISPPLDCLNCQKNICPKNADKPPCQIIDPEHIALAVNRKLTSLFGDDIAVVIPIWKPKVEMLQRCLDAVLPQVIEVIITKDASGEYPNGLKLDAKTKKVSARLGKIGVGRNINHGFRHTHARYVLMLNDDFYLKPDAVQRLKDCMKPGVGLVGQLAHYPDGTIYHAGKVRNPNGGIGHHHVDYRKHRHTITAPMEMENTNCASALIRREAFYQIGGFDERFFMYAEDDDICMRMRKSGWEVWYTPLADGIHDEHQESKLLPERQQIMNASNALFASIWAPYFQHNRGKQGLGDFKYA